MLNGLQDMIDQIGHKLILKLGLPQILTEMFLRAQSNLLPLLLQNNKRKKLHQMLLHQNRNLTPLLLLLIRKRESLELEKIKVKVKLNGLETQEVGDSYGQSTLFPKPLMNLQKPEIKLLKLLLLRLELKDQLKLATLAILPLHTPKLLMMLLKLS